MAKIADEDIQKVIEANDLVSIAHESVPNLKQRGSKFVACCPFHKEKTPSFQIDQNLQLWHCFGCGEGGNLVTFVEKKYDMNFVETIEFLAERANIELHRVKGEKSFDKSKKGRLKQACNMAAQYYHKQLLCSKTEATSSARNYLGDRNFGIDVSKKWLLGYAPGHDMLTKHLLNNNFSIEELLSANLCIKGKDNRAHDRFYNRIIFPIFDIFGDVIAFGGRVIDNNLPKYLNTNDTPLFHKSQCLYGLDKAKANMTANGIAVVVEGYTDVISLHESGINYAVATLGTALTRQHIRLLNQHAKEKIIYLFDGDDAGQRAAERALQFIDQMSLPEVYNKKAQIYALTLPENLDPAEYIDKYGVDKLKELLLQAKPLLDYGIEKKIAQYDLTIPGNRSRAAISALQILAPIKDSLIAKEYSSRIACLTSMREEDVLLELSKIKAPKTFESFNSSNIKSAENNIQTNNNNQNNNNLSKLNNIEIEILCVLSKNPSEVYKILDSNDDFQDKKVTFWSNTKNKEIFKIIQSLIKTNPNIKSSELIFMINQQNNSYANTLTRFSNMYDLKNDPQRHVEYLIYAHNIEEIIEKINLIKNKFNIMSNLEEKEEKYKEFTKLQNKLNYYKRKLNEVI